jgi:nucleotide-binding universal stress UspA family protein
MVLICYDGSDDARAAIERAGALMRGQPAIVLTVWEPYLHVLVRSGGGRGSIAGVARMEEFDRAMREQADRRSEEGTELAREAGLDAIPRTCAQATSTADAILSEAQAVGAEAIVMGSRGLTGVKSLLLGSVSHAVMQHADRTVMVVPSPRVAASRAHAWNAR